MKKEKRKLEGATLSSDIQMIETEVTKDDVINEYAARLGEVVPHIAGLKKNELFRVLLCTIAPTFLMGDRIKWAPKNKKEEAIIGRLLALDDLKIALVEIITREMMAREHQQQVQADEQK